MDMCLTRMCTQAQMAQSVTNATSDIRISLSRVYQRETIPITIVGMVFAMLASSIPAFVVIFKVAS